MNHKKKLKTYNVTYRPDENNRYKTETITYQANDMKEAEALFHAEHPEYKNNKQRYLEIHSPLSNYAVDRENQKSAETPNDINMKKFNILNIFKTVNEYVYHITMLIVGLIPLLLLGVVLFGDDFLLGNIVVYNIQNILDSISGFVGIITLILIVTVFHKFYKNN